MVKENFWPIPEAFFDLSNAKQITDGRARCIGIALCDEDGKPSRSFFQGQKAHFYYEFEMLDDIEVPSGGLLFRDQSGTVIHGKNTFQYGSSVPDSVKRGSRLRFHHILALEVSPGEYTIEFGLASTSLKAYHGYRIGSITHMEFDRLSFEHCRVMSIGLFNVGFTLEGKLLHYGIANLPGESHVVTLSSDKEKISSKSVLTSKSEDLEPSIFHVTHWKAGSQWIYKILNNLAPDRIIKPQLGETQFLHWAIQPGKIYPTVYVTKQQFDSVRLPSFYRKFVIIRDLRDTLISAYFSFKISHPVTEPRMAGWRATLQSLGFDEGLIYLMDEWLPGCAGIQISWLESNEPLIRYEDLLSNDVAILEKVLLDDCQLSISQEKLQEVVMANQFKSQTGRKPGQEDIMSHERKGIAGDWRNYFSEKVKKAFKIRYGAILVEAGYEHDLNW